MPTPYTFLLGRLFDIRVGVHASWFIVFALMTVSIASNLDGVSRPAAFAVAAAFALLLFASVVAHEFAHALVARGFGVRTRAITLFLFGGVATLENEPPSPRAELWIALAGPAMSALIAGLAFGLLVALERFAGAGAIAAMAARTAAYLALANAVLAVFNLVPAFPMDGGRVLRAAVWHVRRSRSAATGAASLVGLLLAAALAACGVAAAIFFGAWQSLWYVAVAVFIARQSWVQLRDSRRSERLERIRVGDVMDAAEPGDLAVADVAWDHVSVAASASALEAAGIFYRSGRMQIAVVDAGKFAGWLRRERVLAIVDRAA